MFCSIERSLSHMCLFWQACRGYCRCHQGVQKVNGRALLYKQPIAVRVYRSRYHDIIFRHIDYRGLDIHSKLRSRGLMTILGSEELTLFAGCYQGAHSLFASPGGAVGVSPSQVLSSVLPTVSLTSARAPLLLTYRRSSVYCFHC